MAPAKPPPSTQSTSAATPRRPRHTPLQSSPPEEASAPTTKGRTEELAPPPTSSHSTARRSGAVSIPDSTEGATTPGPAQNGMKKKAGQLASSSRLGRPFSTAENAEAGKQLSRAGIIHSGEMGPIGRRSLVEGPVGIAGMLLDPHIFMLPGNAGHRNSSSSQPESAPQMLDTMPERNPTLISVMDVPTDDGHAWERGPERVLREGSTVRAIFSSLLQTAPGAGGAEKLNPANSNANSSRRSGAWGGLQADPDAHSEGPNWVTNTPVGASGADEHLASVFPAGLAVRRPDLGHLQETGIASSDGLSNSSRGPWQDNSLISSSEGAAGVKRLGGPYSGYADDARIWGNCTQSAPDSCQFGGATVFGPLEGCPSGEGWMKEGHKGFDFSRGRRGEAPRKKNEGTSNRATFHHISAGAVGIMSTPSQRAPHTSIWGRPMDLGRVRGWSPDYREAFFVAIHVTILCMGSHTS